DHELVEFTARIPAKYATQGMAGKLILKAAVEDLLPRETVYRKKMGFPTPWAYWLAGPQLDQLEQFLLEPRTVERNYFRADAVQATSLDGRAGVGRTRSGQVAMGRDGWRGRLIRLASQENLRRL